MGRHVVFCSSLSPNPVIGPCFAGKFGGGRRWRSVGKNRAVRSELQ